MYRVWLKLASIIVLLCLVSQITIADPSNYYFIVKKGDSLAMILSTLNACPLYGKNNSVDRTIKTNSNILDHNGNLILPGSKISLPLSTLKRSKDYYVKNYEVFITNLNAKNCSTNNKVLVTNKKKQRRIASSEEQKDNENKKYKEPAEDDDFDPVSWIGFQPQFSYLRINGKDLTTQGTAVVLSNLNIGGTLSWRQVWSDRTRSEINLSAMKVKMYPSTTKTISDGTQTLTKFGFLYEYFLNPRLFVGFDMTAQQEMTFQAISTNELKLPLATIFKGGPKIGIILAKVKKLSLTAEGGARYLTTTTSADQTFSGGLKEYHGKLLIQHFTDRRGLLGGINYRTENLKSNLINEQIIELGFELGYFMRFGD